MSLCACSEKETYREQLLQFSRSHADIQSFAQALDVFEVKYLIAFLVRALPILPLPYRLPRFEITKSGHKPLANSVEFLQSQAPLLEDVPCFRDEVERLVRPIDDIDDGDPSVLVIFWSLELETIIARVLAQSKLFDTLNGN